MFGRGKQKNKAKKNANQKAAQKPQPTPITTNEEIKYMPNGQPYPDWEIPATDGNISLLKEQDEVIKKLNEQLQVANIARRQILRTIVSSQPDMPKEDDLLFDYHAESQAVRVYKKTTLQAAQLAAQERAAAAKAAKETELENQSKE